MPVLQLTPLCQEDDDSEMVNYVQANGHYVWSPSPCSLARFIPSDLNPIKYHQSFFLPYVRTPAFASAQAAAAEDWRSLQLDALEMWIDRNQSICCFSTWKYVNSK